MFSLVIQKYFLSLNELKNITKQAFLDNMINVFLVYLIFYLVNKALLNTED